MISLISEQSSDIAKSVDSGGTGNQGIVYGYATDETPELMPMPFMVATYAMEILRRIDTFLISCQHREDVPMEALRIIIGCAMIAAAAHYGLNRDFKMLVNPTGSFVVGGSFADTSVTGRKSSRTATGAYAVMAAALSPAKTPPRLTAPARIWRGRLPATSLPQTTHIAAKYRSPMPSASVSYTHLTLPTKA